MLMVWTDTHTYKKVQYSLAISVPVHIFYIEAQYIIYKAYTMCLSGDFAHIEKNIIPNNFIQFAAFVSCS